MRGEQASPRSGDASGAIAEGDESKNDDEDDDRAELHHLLRDRRTVRAFLLACCVCCVCCRPTR